MARLLGLVLLGFLMCSEIQAIDFVCTEADATITFDDDDLTALGVCDNDEDYLIVHNVETDNFPDVGASCFYQREAAGPNTLTWDLDECLPECTQNDTYICFIYYARNYEGGQVRRDNKCHKMECCFSREEVLNSDVLTMTLNKVDLQSLHDQASVTIELQTFASTVARVNGVPEAQAFTVSDPIYAKVALTNPNTPDSFWVQIDQCDVVDLLAPGTTQTYELIANGGIATVDAKANLFIGSFASKSQTFEFDSFVWTNDAVVNKNQFYIVCTIYLCKNGTDTADCNDAQFPGRRRRGIAFDENWKQVTAGPLYIL